MSESEFEGKPVIRDKRRIDPETGKAREATDGDAATSGVPAGGTDGAEVPATADEGAPASEADPLEQAKAENADLFDQLQRAKADLYNLDQRHSNFVRRSRTDAEAASVQGVASVVEALIPVLDDVAAAREHGELTGPFASIAEKLEQTLTSRFALERFGSVGDEFNPEVHEALMHQQSDEATAITITTVVQPGYRVNDRVVRPARVAVTGPQ